MENKISIIVPVYNLEQYILRTVQSICNQTYTDLEIILVDDGSNDNSPQIIKEVSKEDSRIIVISKENEGVTSARMKGIEVATGDWIGFVDGDDVVDEDMYERLLKNAVNENASISHCGYKMVFPDRIDYYYNTGKYCVQDRKNGVVDLLTGSFVEPGLCNKLFRKDVIQRFLNSGQMDLSIKNYEDLLMNYYLFKESAKSVYEDFCPYHYMVRKDSAATSSLNENKLRDPAKVLEIILDDAEEMDVQTIVKRRLLSQMIFLATVEYGEQKALIRPYRQRARKFLRTTAGGVLAQNYPTKLKLQVAGASLFPSAYGFVHRMYSRARGLDSKYRV